MVRLYKGGIYIRKKERTTNAHNKFIIIHRNILIQAYCEMIAYHERNFFSFSIEKKMRNMYYWNALYIMPLEMNCFKSNVDLPLFESLSTFDKL